MTGNRFSLSTDDITADLSRSYFKKVTIVVITKFILDVHWLSMN